MSDNKLLNAANRAKKDEFYTQLSDIEKELCYYRQHFANKVVYCNCDDPTQSNFWKYFSLQFERLGLKKLMATCYKNPSHSLLSDHTAERSFYIEYCGDQNDNRVPDPEEIGIKYLQGDGDFRSQECVELLKQADIVVTNPPFSLFREYIAQLAKHDKRFLVIGNMNAITYKGIFPLMRDGKLWYGHSTKSGNLEFGVPRYYPLTGASTRVDEEGNKFVRVKGIRWFTNLEHAKRDEELVVFKKYSPEEYPKYDNYDAINVNRTAHIPRDYGGVMGVPISFLDKYNPAQFEILGATESEGKGFSGGLWDSKSQVAQAMINGRRVYKRLFIRRKNSRP